MRSVKFSIALSRLTDFAQEFSIERVAQYMTRAVTVANVEIAARSERHVGRHEINRPLTIARVLAWISMNPDFFSRERCLYHAAAIDIAMIKKLVSSFAPQLQPVCSSTKALTEGSNEPPSLIENN